MPRPRKRERTLFAGNLANAIKINKAGKPPPERPIFPVTVRYFAPKKP